MRVVLRSARYSTGVKLILMSEVLCALLFNLHYFTFLPLSPVWTNFQNITCTEPSSSELIRPCTVQRATVVRAVTGTSDRGGRPHYIENAPNGTKWDKKLGGGELA